MIGVRRAMRASLSMTTIPSAPKFEVITNPSANCSAAHSSISSTLLDSNSWESFLISPSVNLFPPSLKGGGEMKRDYGTNGNNWERAPSYFRLFRNLSSFHHHNLAFSLQHFTCDLTSLFLLFCPYQIERIRFHKCV